MKKLFLFFVVFCTCILSVYAQAGSVELTSDFSEREVMVHVPSGNLYGTLTIPINNELGIVALVVPDFGLTDRDGNSIQTGENNSIKMLAESLAKEGISTLRIEKREVTESKSAVVPKSGVRIEDMVEDAVRWLRFLKADKRFNKVAVIGHGEGALVGMLAAEITDITYYISIAGLARPGYEVVEDNLATLFTTEQLDTVRMYIEEMKKGNTVGDIEGSFASVFNSAIQPYLISWFKYNPAVEITNLKAKVLLIHGTADMQVGLNDFSRLVAAYPQSEELVIDGMNHLLRNAEQQDNGACKLPVIPLAEGLVNGIALFLKGEKSKIEQ